MIYWKLFWDFFKVSCFTFGGAYGAIPLIRDMVLGNGWLSDGELTHMIAVSESTPGPIMVNLATYVGSHQAGFWGSLTATVAVVLPAYIVIMLVVSILENAISNENVQAVLRGLKPCVTGVVVATGLHMVLQGAMGDPMDLLTTAILGTFVLVFPRITKKDLSPIGLICASAVLGILLFGL